MSGWLELADVTLNSGRRSSFKIECDDLTDEEVAAGCALLSKLLPPFGSVFGVPTGGVRVEDAIRPFMTDGPPLFIDDVWTTGGSLRRYHSVMMPDHGPIGSACGCLTAVIFARGRVPYGVPFVFQMHEGLWSV